MIFKPNEYVEPNFELDYLIDAPNVHLEKVIKDGIAPKNYHAMSVFPEYFKINGQWILATNSRMDAVAVVSTIDDKVAINIVEFRNLKVGDMVVIGRYEDGSQGIYVHTNGFGETSYAKDKFSFRSGRSRETAYSTDYDRLYEILEYEKANQGKITWVLGTAIGLDQASRKALVNMIEKGYVDTIICGNSLVALDLELASFDSVWGQDVFSTEQNTFDNYYKTINIVRKYGSIKKYVQSGLVKNGFVKACYENNVNLVIAGSIRDRFTFPETVDNVYQAQDLMRSHIKESSVIIMISAILFSIASGNMTPSYNVIKGKVRPIYLYAVDIQEFAVNKLSDRGSLTAKTIVTNAQDFMSNLSRALK